MHKTQGKDRGEHVPPLSFIMDVLGRDQNIFIKRLLILGTWPRSDYLFLCFYILTLLPIISRASIKEKSNVKQIFLAWRLKVRRTFKTYIGKNS